MKKKEEKIINKILEPLGLENIKILRYQKGDVLLKVELEEKMLNYKGALHGGISYTFSDICAGITCLTYGKKVQTLQGSINYMKPGIRGPLYAKGKIIHNGRSTKVVNVEVIDGTDRVITNGIFTMFVIEDI